MSDGTMTGRIGASNPDRPPRSRARAVGRQAWPIVAVGLAIVAVWYGLSLYYNWPQASQASPHAGFWETAKSTMNLAQPWVPPPHQVVQNLASGLVYLPSDPSALRVHLFSVAVYVPTPKPPSDSSALWVHLGTTGGEMALGLVAGCLLGLLIASAFVHIRLLERAFLPWVVASQTVPVLALAPIVISLIGINLTGKVAVTGYLVFFAVTVSSLKGLRSADALAHELMRSYAATTWQVYWKLRFPAALPYIFTGLKIGATAALTGAIIAELFGSNYGLGQRIVFATYYNQTIVWWSTMLAASLLGLAAFTALSILERLVVRTQPR